MSDTTRPTLVVCNLDHNLLHNRDAECALLDHWMAGERGHRPLLAYCSQRSIERIVHLLPSSVLPPPDFLIGQGTGILVRHSFWNQEGSLEGTSDFIGLAPEHLLEAVASNATANLDAPDGAVAEILSIDNAVLTMAGLRITFSHAVGAGSHSANDALLAWLLDRLKLLPNDVQYYAGQVHHRARPRRFASH